MSTIVYLLQVSACTAFFMVLYYFILKRLTFFTLNRWYLITTLIFSLIIPLLTITIRQEYVPAIQGVIYFNKFRNLPGQIQNIGIQKAAAESYINWLLILKATYLIVALALFIRLITVIAVFFSKITLKNSTRLGKVCLVKGNKSLINGSFLNYIILNDEGLNQGETDQIIEHEMLHVKLLHSVDRVIIEMVKIILWFNPVIYLYARAIEENHEFEVDREMGLLADKNTYANLLLRLSVTRQRMIYNTFSQLPLERRITMLFNQPTKNMKKIIYVLVVPIAAISCLAFANLKAETTTNTEKAPVNQRNLSADSAAQKAALPFFSRKRIQYANGKKHDVITFTLTEGAGTADLGTEDKAGAFIDGVFYNEDALKKLSPAKTALLTFAQGPIDAKKIPDGEDYAIPFLFKTMVKQK